MFSKIAECRNVQLLSQAKLFGKTPRQDREPKLQRLTGPLNNSKGSL